MQILSTEYKCILHLLIYYVHKTHDYNNEVSIGYFRVRT